MDSLSLLASQDKLGSLRGVLTDNQDITLAQKNEALKHAARQGNRGCVGLLLDHEAEVDHQDRHYGMAPIHWAAINGRLGVVATLMARGARVDTADREGRSPHQLALLYRHPNTAWTINRNEAKAITANGPGDRMCIAVCANRVDQLQNELRKFADPDAINQFGDPALHHAIRVDHQGNTPCVEALLRAGADPLSTCSYGFTAMHWAALYGRVQIGHLLMYYGAGRTVTIRDVSGRTPAEVSEAYNHPREYKAWQLFEHMSMILRIDEPSITGEYCFKNIYYQVTNIATDKIVLEGAIGADPHSPEARKLLLEPNGEPTFRVEVKENGKVVGTFNVCGDMGGSCGMKKDKKGKKKRNKGAAATAAAADAPAGPEALEQEFKELQIKKEKDEP